MRITALLGIAAVLLASTGASDPIDQVVAKAFAVSGFSGKGKDYQIMNKRQVQIDGVPYMAMLIRTGHQGGTVLFKYEGTSWWSRIVTVAPDKMP
jgi:hypothetical protein